MEDEYTIECQECSWSGDHSDLVCSDEDSDSEKEISEIDFNLCPNCGSLDIEDLD